jgi:hypothetical protein
MKMKSMKVPKTEATMMRCICNACPSYTECMQGGVMGVFCATGSAEDCAMMEIEDCMCTDCMNEKEFNLDGKMYCKMGPAEMMMK